jgi:uncharacterized membrane protein
MKSLYDFFTRYGVAIFFGIGAVLSVLVFVTISMAYPENNPTLDGLFQDHSSIFNYAIYVSLALIVLGIIVMFGSYLANTVINIKTSTKSLIAIAVIFILYFVTQAMGGSDDILLAHYSANEQEMGITADIISKVDGLLKMAFIFILASLAAWGFSFAKKAIS